MTTAVHLTIDTECREERIVGANLTPAAGYDLRVWGHFANQTDPLGIEFIMSELERYGFRATFYIDPFGSVSFGKSALAHVIQTIISRGHDVQLHAHPRQKQARWATEGRSPASDFMSDYDLSNQVDLLNEGMHLLETCGQSRQSIVSFRAGHFSANPDTWLAMAACGLPVSSNYNLCYLPKSCRLSWPTSTHVAFDTKSGVIELPITNFQEGSQSHYRHLQITAVSFAELKHALLQAHRLGYPDVTLVSHSFEFCFIDSVGKQLGRPNRINMTRLKRLLAFLDQHRFQFSVETVLDFWKRIEAPEAIPRRFLGMPVTCLQNGHGLRLGRYIEQMAKRLDGHLTVYRE